MPGQCPHCKGGLITRENGHYHCLLCARNFKLVPMRGEQRRMEIIEASKTNDVFTPYCGAWNLGQPVLPGQRKCF